MLAKRIIPCLDVDKNRVVKGISFSNLFDAGDPVTLAKFYNAQGADELTFFDIVASVENRNTTLDMVKKIAKEIFIPFTVGGGIRTLTDARNTLLAGADKISLNSAAIKNPKIISDAANIYGSQCIVVAIDAKAAESSWEVYINGGKVPTGIDVIDWARKVVALGAGEILLTSIDADGTKKGFNLSLTKTISEQVSVPVIASGGAGKMSDFYDVFTKANADGALAASLFHFKELEIKRVKKYLKEKGIVIRD